MAEETATLKDLKPFESVPLNEDEEEGYCMKCKSKVIYKIDSYGKAKNAKTEMAIGKCPICKTTVSRIVKKTLSEEEEKVYEADKAERARIKNEKKLAEKKIKEEEKSAKKAEKRKLKKQLAAPTVKKPRKTEKTSDKDLWANSRFRAFEKELLTDIADFKAVRQAKFEELKAEHCIQVAEAQLASGSDKEEPAEEQKTDESSVLNFVDCVEMDQ